MIIVTQDGDKAIFVDKIAYLSVKGNTAYVHLVGGETVKYGSYRSFDETDEAVNTILKKIGEKKV